MAKRWRPIRGKFSPEEDEERIRKSVEEAAGGMREVESLDDEAKIAALRAAIESGLASGVVKPGIFARIRERYGLPMRES